MELDATAALVMAWASPLYEGGRVRDFFDELDLSKGEALLKRCEEVCPWYGEVILNRKHLISRLVGRELARAPEPCRVVVPAAGMSPLALEVLEEYPDSVTDVVEIDISGMAEKHALYEQVAPDLAGRIACVRADITAPSLAPYAGNGPVVLVVEGVSYYLGREALGGMISSFCSGNGRNVVVVEYLAPCQMVAQRRRSIPRSIFGSIRDACGLAPLSVYTPGGMASVLRDAGGRVDAHYSMATMERMRCGENHFFRSDEDGWIWCTKGRI
jgi:O-methyltransferase involved in polyketide biosynthesis